MPVEIFVGDRPLEDLTPDERRRLGKRLAELSSPAAVAAAERSADEELRRMVAEWPKAQASGDR